MEWVSSRLTPGRGRDQGHQGPFKRARVLGHTVHREGGGRRAAWGKGMVCLVGGTAFLILQRPSCLREGP